MYCVMSNFDSTVDPLHNGPPWGQKKVAVVKRWQFGGGSGCNMNFFFKGVRHVYCAKFMLTVPHNVREREKIHKES